MMEKKLKYLYFLLILFSFFCSCFLPEEEGFLKEKALVIIPVGGLANRLRAMASGYVMAKHTGRKLIVNWSPIKGEVFAHFNELFENKFESFEAALLETITEKYSAPLTSQDLMGISNSSESNILIENAFSKFCPIEMKLEDCLSIYMEFYNTLIPVRQVRETVEQFKREHAWEEGEIMGVHYRSWALSADGANRPLSDPMLYVVKMKEYLEQNNKIRFYLATDDVTKIAFFKQEVGADKILHLPILKVKRESLEDQRLALSDWLLLSQTSLIIGTYHSSFSDEAALLTKLKMKIDVGPVVYK